MHRIQKSRKWHFLLLGSTLILLSAILWYWNWRSLGLPVPFRAEHFITAVSFIVGFIVLGLFVYRLNRYQVAIMLVGMVIVNMLAALGTLWIFRSYPTFFELIRPEEISVYNPDYVTEWLEYFVTPAVYAVHSGLLLLWVVSLVMFIIRKPTDQPE